MPSASKRKKNKQAPNLQGQKRPKNCKTNNKPNKNAKPPKEERLAFVVFPPQHASDEPKIENYFALDEIQIHDVLLRYTADRQTIGMIVTTHGEKYQWRPSSKQHPLTKKKHLEIHASARTRDTESAAYLDETGKVYTRVRQIPNKQKTPQWTLVNFPRKTKKIVDVVVSGQTFVALSRSGQLFTWGINNHGSLGVANEDIRIQPGTIQGLDSTGGSTRISQIAGGGSMIAALKGKQLYTWGSNRQGMLGYIDNGDDSDASHYAMQCLVETRDSSIFSDVKQVCCGEAHVVALTTQGTVYAWGDGQKGQLGGNNLPYQASRLPVFVSISEPIRSIGCGHIGSLALSEKGNVYAWGHGTLGEAEKPRKLDFPDAFEPVKVECAGAVLLILARRRPLPPKKKDHSKSPTIGGGNVSQRNDFQNNGFSNYGFSGKQSFSDTFAPAQQTSYYDDQHDDNDPKSK